MPWRGVDGGTTGDASGQTAFMTTGCESDAASTVVALVAALNDHDLDRASGLFAAKSHNHGRPTGPDGMRALFAAQRSAVPDLHHEIEALHCDGNAVTTRSTLSGTHAGTAPEPFASLPFNGALAGIEPSARKFRIQAIHIWETGDGFIVGHWACRDDLGLRGQLQSPRTQDAG